MSFYTNQLQMKILYVISCDAWVTVNSNNQLMQWDLERQKGEVFHTCKAKISDIMEIQSMKLIAVSSFDKKVLFYDLKVQ